MAHHTCLHCATWGAYQSYPLQRPEHIISLLPVANEVPNFHGEGERVELRLQRQVLRQTTVELEQDLKKLRDDYKRLYVEKVTAERNERDIDLLLNPVRVLPTEILQRIFIAARDSSVTHASKENPFGSPLFIENSLEMRTSPWNVSQVSQNWRAAALGHPRLWSLIGYPLHDGMQLTPGRLCLYAGQLSRARGSPLNISLRVDDQSSLSALPTLLSSASGWTCLMITSLTSAGLNRWSTLSSFFTSLTHLHVNIQHHPDPNVEDVSLFCDARRLQTVSASNYTFASLQIPWDQLQTVSIVGDRDPLISGDFQWQPLQSQLALKLDTFWRHVKLAKNLQNLFIADSHPLPHNVGDDDGSHYSSFPSLRNLWINESMVMLQVAGRAKAPALSSLHLEHKVWHDNYFESLRVFLHYVLDDRQKSLDLHLITSLQDRQANLPTFMKCFERVYDLRDVKACANARTKVDAFRCILSNKP